jgi:hypothetical protein
LKKPIVSAALAVVIGLAVFAALSARGRTRPDEVGFGVTFSVKYAEELGLDWRANFTALLDDLGVRKFRIPMYWNRIEHEPGIFDWSETDWIVSEAEKRGAEIILAIGRKTPRWPECHSPAWAEALTPEEQRARVLAFIGEEVGRYRTSPAVRWWQVENEPLFDFGICPPPDRELLKAEVDLVRSLDARPVMVTDSGELSTWIRTASLSDVLGVSLYRVVWNEYLGFLFWPVSPSYYRDRFSAILPLARARYAIVSELQAEPWFNKSFHGTPVTEQFESMNIKRFRDNVDFGRRTGVREIYLWGAEWWYWLKEKGDPAFWDEAKPLF